MNEIQALGIMSGSSLDGLDISCGEYRYENELWHFNWVAGYTYEFPIDIKNNLSTVRSLTSREIRVFDLRLGEWIGDCVNQFISEFDVTPRMVGSHGHTVFHEPDVGMTLQVGNGHAIARQSGLVTYTDFRQKDILFGGQGAPLVPIGDLLLYPEYDFCLNLGGIANISEKGDGLVIAFDIVPCNQVLNYIASRLGLAYDPEGRTARKGKMIEPWFEQLNSHSYFSKDPPKSLGNEWVNREIISVIPRADPADLLFTFSHFIALKIAESLEGRPPGKILVTGGGAHNSFLMELIKDSVPRHKVTVPEAHIIDYKESIIFGLMAVLRHLGQINILKSVTGASKDLSSGVRHDP